MHLVETSPVLREIQAATLAGNPAIPLVKALTARVAATDAEAGKWVHYGATSQDVIDSGQAQQYLLIGSSEFDLGAQHKHLQTLLNRFAQVGGKNQAETFFAARHQEAGLHAPLG